jgi:hypothetical protein
MKFITHHCAPPVLSFEGALRGETPLIAQLGISLSNTTID